MGDIHRVGRIVRNGRIAVFWKIDLPDELSEAAESFIKSCGKLPEAVLLRLDPDSAAALQRDFPIRAELICERQSDDRTSSEAPDGIADSSEPIEKTVIAKIVFRKKILIYRKFRL